MLIRDQTGLHVTLIEKTPMMLEHEIDRKSETSNSKRDFNEDVYTILIRLN